MGNPALWSVEPSCIAWLSPGVPNFSCTESSWHSPNSLQGSGLGSHPFSPGNGAGGRQSTSWRCDRMKKRWGTLFAGSWCRKCWISVTGSSMAWSGLLLFIFPYCERKCNISLGNLGVFSISDVPSYGPVQALGQLVLLLTARMCISKFKANCLLRERGQSRYYSKASPQRGSWSKRRGWDMLGSLSSQFSSPCTFTWTIQLYFLLFVSLFIPIFIPQI